MGTTKARMCGDKIRHANREAAWLHARAFIRQGAAPNILGIYKCRHCKKWHIGRKR